MSNETKNLPENYLELAAQTAIYSPQWAVIYPALGLGNEVAEMVEKVFAGAPVVDVMAELGDVLWYVAALARDARLLESELAWAERSAMHASDNLSAMIAAAGNAQGHVKKALRDNDGDLDARRERLGVSLRELLAAADGYARHHGMSLDEVAAANLAKLADRAARNTLKGDGDVR